MLRPLVTRWRGFGFRIVYLDDGLGMETDETKCEMVANVIHRDLLDTVFLPNYEKSVWKPLSKVGMIGVFVEYGYGVFGAEIGKVATF